MTKSSTEIQNLVSSGSLIEECLSLKMDTVLEKFSTDFQRFGEVLLNYKSSVIDIIQKRTGIKAQLQTLKLYTRPIDGLKITLKKTVYRYKWGH